jgi:hypothetical protein
MTTSSSSASGFDSQADSDSGAMGALPDDSQIWHGLKQAIAASSGFQSWQRERGASVAVGDLSLDVLVRRYLRETLETLAY